MPNRGRLLAGAILAVWMMTRAAQAQSFAESEAQRIATIARIAPGVVCVMSPTGQGGGSGVLISADGYAVSNYHVTSACGNFMKCGLNDGRVYDAVVVGLDPTGDIALLKMVGRDDFPAATPGDSDRVRVGDQVLALGNPFLLAEDFTPTVTFGIVSGVHRYQYPADTFLEYTDCIQIDASINPGNSGGPLFDSEGRWIGINGRASFEKRGRVNTGAAYAISVRQIRLFLGALRCGLIVDHGTADFTLETLSDGRVVVDRVSDVSEAFRRGLRPQAELIAFAGRQITSANDFQNVLGIFPEGSRVAMTWRDRNGVHSATIRLRPLHAFQVAPELPGERRPAPPDPEHTPDENTESTQPEAPAALAELFEERSGYANFHFNVVARERVMEPLRTRLDGMYSGDRAASAWAVRLIPADRGVTPLELVIGKSGVGLTQGNRNWYQPSDEPDPAQEPATWPGLLMAAMQWRMLFEGGAAAFNDLSAAGQFTHLPTERSADVILTRDGTRMTRWYFADHEELPFAMDLEFAAGQDECRLVFADWGVLDGIMVPARLGIVAPDSETLQWLDVQPAIAAGDAASVTSGPQSSGVSE